MIGRPGRVPSHRSHRETTDAPQRRQQNRSLAQAEAPTPAAAHRHASALARATLPSPELHGPVTETSWDAGTVCRMKARIRCATADDAFAIAGLIEAMGYPVSLETVRQHPGPLRRRGLAVERGLARLECVVPGAHEADARRHRADDEVVMAALLHDVGHLSDAGADAETLHHGHHGAGLLRPFVPPRVTWLVEYHVVAKRYLCTVDPRDAARLSPVSAQSLLLQGPVLPLEERLALETRPWFVDAVRIRRWDDEAKVAGAVVPPLDEYRALLERWLGPQSRCGSGMA